MTSNLQPTVIELLMQGYTPSGSPAPITEWVLARVYASEGVKLLEQRRQWNYRQRSRQPVSSGSRCVPVFRRGQLGKESEGKRLVPPLSGPHASNAAKRP